jgi:FMN phosphatase YigB (HAD superfamily)
MLAVVFDLGNVLVRLDYARAAARFSRLRGVQIDLEALYELPEVEALGRGTISPAALFDALERHLAVRLDPGSWCDAWCDLFTPWPEMEALAGAVIDAEHPAFLASNTDRLHFEYVKARMPVLDRMRGRHLSYEVGALKPEPSFFEGLLDRFGLRAGECVFLDDRPENVAAARAFGIRSLVFAGDVGTAYTFLREAGVRI